MVITLHVVQNDIQCNDSLQCGVHFLASGIQEEDDVYQLLQVIHQHPLLAAFLLYHRLGLLLRHRQDFQLLVKVL